MKAVRTKRQSIEHIHKMKPVDFIDWMKTVKSESGGVLRDIKAVMKIDGLGARFGKDSEGRPFFEGSNTGPIFEDGAFSRYARSKGSSSAVVTRAIHYDHLLEISRESAAMRVLPNDTKVICEIFYNPMAKEEGTGITFVTVRYDKRKLGDLMTIMPYSVVQASTGLPHPDEDRILDDLFEVSGKRIKIIDPNLTFTSIDVNAFASVADAFGQTCMRVLMSRKHADKSEKDGLRQNIQMLKDDLSTFILNHPGIEGKYKLGPDIEGVVLHLPIGDQIKLFKITTKEFQQAHAAQRRQR